MVWNSRLKLQLSLLTCSALGWMGLGWLPLDLSSPSQPQAVQWGSPAAARSSGGRSGGGSFSRPSSSSRGSSSSRSSTPRQPSSSGFNSGGSYQPRGGGTVIVPVPVPQVPYYPNSNSGYSNSTSSGDDSGDWVLGLLLLLGGAGGIGYVVWLLVKAVRPKTANVYDEIDNDRVTITKLQVALLATARAIQQDLTAISLKIDTSTQEGLLQLLQESALALLRHPEFWTHVSAESKTLASREAAQQRFNQLSIAERSKFSAETLVNVGGSRRQIQVAKPNADESAAYIVVTLLVGTANDQPLFESVLSAESLRSTLEAIAAFPADYLFTVELLWSPQDESDSLTYDELLTEYTDMRQL